MYLLLDYFLRSNIQTTMHTRRTSTTRPDYTLYKLTKSRLTETRRRLRANASYSPLQRVLHAGQPSDKLEQSPLGAFLGDQLGRGLASELHEVLFHLQCSERFEKTYTSRR